MIGQASSEALTLPGQGDGHLTSLGFLMLIDGVAFQRCGRAQNCCGTAALRGLPLPLGHSAAYSEVVEIVFTFLPIAFPMRPGGARSP